MPGNEVVGLSAAMNVEDVLTELKRIGVGSEKEARAIAGAMDKAARDAAKSAKKIADDLKKAGEAGGASFAKAAKSLGPLGGVLSRLSPEAGAAASSIAGLTSAAEGFEAAELGITAGAAATALGALAVAVGAGALVWAAYNEPAAEAARIAGEVAEAHARLTPLIDAARLAEIDAAVAIGDMTAEAGKLEKDGIASMKAFAAATAETSKQIRALHDQQGSATQSVKDSVVSWAAYGAEIQGGWNPIANAAAFYTDALITTSSDLQVEVDALMGTMDDAADATGRTADAHRITAAAAGKHTDAAAELTAQLLKEARAAQQVADAMAAKIAAVEAEAAHADEIVAKSGAFRLSETDKLAQQRDDDLTAYAAAAEKGGVLAEDRAAGEAAIVANYQEQITAKVQEESAKRQAAEEAASAAAMQAQEAAFTATIGRINEVGGYVTQALGTVSAASEAAYALSADTAQRLTDQLAAGEAYYTDAQKTALEERTDAAKEAARKQFGAAKAAKVAEAVASTALAAINAIAQSPPPSPFGLIGAGIATAAGVAAAATISSTEPAFHAGYAPDEMQARVLKNEPIVSPVGASILGRDNIASANKGKSPSSYTGPAPIVLGHRVVDDVIKRELANGGALATALSDGRIVGHRTNRRGTSG